MDDITLDALRKIRAEAHKLEEGHGYPMVSVRSLAEKLGLSDQIDSILAACADGGFNYCLDRTVPAHDGRRPDQQFCYWGPDQLRSRLDCVDSRIYR